jgi:hypothetical protein
MVGKRVFRTFACGLTITLFFGGAFAWQSSDDEIKDMARHWERLTSILRIYSPSSPDGAAEQASKASDQALISGNLQTTSVNQPTPGSLAAGTSAQLQHHLESIGNDIVMVQRVVDQLAARQEQMAQDIATLRLTEQHVIDRLSPLSQATIVYVPQRQNGQRIVQSDGFVQSNSARTPVRQAQSPLSLSPVSNSRP